MNENKFKVQFIYRHSLAREISRHVFIREYKRKLSKGPKSLYCLDQDGDLLLDKNNDPIYCEKFIKEMESDKALQQMMEDYFHYYDLIAQFLRFSESELPPETSSFKAIEKDTISFRKKLQNFFQMF